MRALEAIQATRVLMPGRSVVQQELDDLHRLQDEDAGELLLIRHAEPARRGAALPADDPLLSCPGLAQAERLAERLQDLWTEAIYSAPERRALQTAQVVAEGTGRPVVVLDDLRDIDYYRGGEESEGIALIDRFAETPRWDALPGFAPSRSFRRRAILAVDSVLAAHGGQRAAIISHSSVINAYLSMVLDIPRDIFFAPDHASISVVRSWHQYYAVRALNDVSHLQA